MQAPRRPPQQIQAAFRPARRTSTPIPATRRFILHLTALLLIALIALAVPIRAHAAEIAILNASLDSTEEGYRLSTAYSFELNHGLESTIMRGVPLYFTTDVEVTRHRWYWLDQTAASTSQTIRVSYNVLTRQFHASVNNSLQQNFGSLEDVMAFVRRPPRWIIAGLKDLRSGETYNVAVRMRLDVAQLSKPLQVNALNDSDWRLSSNWISFNYRPE
ncbi:MAG: proline rich signal peptide protein [Herbaspirillum sp.]|jgi:hypothetical protein|nr:proline rich signal peptide protein [Herbaspirillum sp.]